MKAVILAAGSGKRIRDHHTLPKGLIEIDDQPIVTRSITLLKNHGITDILLIIGYGAEHYEKIYARDPLVTLIYNDKFATYENLYSLYMARDWIDQDFLLLESDILYEQTAISTLLNTQVQNAVLISQPSQSNDEVFVECDTNHQLVAMSKNLDSLKRSRVLGEFVGISKISFAAYRKLLEQLMKDSALLQNGHYEENGFVWLTKSMPILCIPAWDLLWCEIDNKKHFENAKLLARKIAHKQQIKLNAALPIQRNILLNPGPVTTSDSVKRAVLVPDICHREREFTDLVKSIRLDLLRVVQADPTQYTTIPFCASGTGAIEACLSSVITNDETLLVINNGSYGQRILEIVQSYKLKTCEFKCSFTEEISLAEIEKILAANPTIKSLAVVHHETSSGILNPVTLIGDFCKKHNLRFIVDAMSSFAGVGIDVQRDNIDYLIASSNKCLHGLPGLSFVIAKLDALKQSEKNTRNYYLNLLRTYKALESSEQMPFTPPVQILYSLRQALDELLTEGVANRITRFHHRYTQLKTGLCELGFRCLTPKAKESQLLMMLQFPADFPGDFDALHDFLYQSGYTIYPHKLPIENSFRLSCIGELTEQDIGNFLHEVKIYLHEVNTIQKSKIGVE